MGVIGLTNYHTLVDLAKRVDPKGNTADIIDTLAEQNPMLEEAHWEEANDINSHQMTQVLTEPTPGFGRINKGVPFTAARVKQVTEPICSITDALRIDERLLAKAPNAAEYFRREADIHLRAMGKNAHKVLLYGNGAQDPDSITGFMARYNSKDNVINGGATAGNTASILVVKWGRDGAFMIYPRGFKSLINEEGPKSELIEDNGGGYYAQVAIWRLNMGLCIAKEKNVQRIANLAVTGSSNIFNPDLLVTALDRLDNTDGAVIYVPKAIYTQMNINLMNKSNSYYTREEEWGRPVTKFMGVPVKCCDQMLTTETPIDFT